MKAAGSQSLYSVLPVQTKTAAAQEKASPALRLFV
jgi:hypothetical protein